jgi:uncharacterized protein YozE (UPF0346 family)
MPNFDNLHQKYREEASRYLKDLKRRDYFQELYDIAEAKANFYQQCATFTQKNKGDLVSFLDNLTINDSNIPKNVVDKELYLDTWEREVKKIMWSLE